jgi:hypothetical protein
MQATRAETGLCDIMSFLNRIGVLLSCRQIWINEVILHLMIAILVARVFALFQISPPKTMSRSGLFDLKCTRPPLRCLSAEKDTMNSATLSVYRHLRHMPVES